MAGLDRSFFKELFLSGVSRWNDWRADNSSVWPDLLELSYPGKDLTGINLDSANLLGANLQGTDLSGANLRNANLKDSRLSEAVLCGVNLREANLHNADLRSADLTAADLRYANLTLARLEYCQMDKVALGATTFGQTSLARVRGLERIFQGRTSPSSIDLQTLETTMRDLRGDPPRLDLFRRLVSRMGIPGGVIEACAIEHPIPEWYSCFVSFSSEDEVFVRRLDRCLSEVGISSFVAPRSSVVGSEVEKEIETNIALQDRVVVVCSKASLQSSWVQKEIKLALEKKEATEEQCVVPVDLDGYLMRRRLPREVGAVAATLRGQVVGDFVGWQSDSEKFSRSLSALLTGLRLKQAP